MKKKSVQSFVFALSISFVGMLMAYFLSKQVNKQIVTQRYLQLENVAKQLSIRFQDAIDISLNDLQALKAFYSINQKNNSQGDFNQYMHILDIENRHYIQALSWVPLVKHNDKETFEHSIRLEQPDFNITERNDEGQLTNSQPKATYTPVTFISPFQKNKKAQGFDLSSNDSRRKSLEYARDNGKMTTTAKITLVQETGSSVGFLIIAPIYKKNTPLIKKEERIDALIGYVTGVFRIDTLMEKVKNQADYEGLELTLFDLDKHTGGLLYGKEQSSNPFRYELVIPDRKWQLGISLNEALSQNVESSSIAKWILAGGFLVSILLGFSIYFLKMSMIHNRNIASLSKQLQNQNNELEIKVVERTKSLEEKNNQLGKNINELHAQRIALSRLMEESEAAKLFAEERATDLARSNKDLDDFAYVASHDLKAPLRGIDQLALWVSEDIEEGDLAEVPENLKMMRNRVQRLETLLVDLLEYSRANRKNYDVALVNGNTHINELFILISPPEGFTLTIKGVLPTFSTVMVPFEQVVRNLLSNSIKHHHKDIGTITVWCDEHDDLYQFFIKDDGPGIAPDFHEDIFNMFKTLKPRDETEGSGMGLALVRKIIEFNGGHIYIESTVNQGSIFSFTWPKIINVS